MKQHFIKTLNEKNTTIGSFLVSSVNENANFENLHLDKNTDLGAINNAPQLAKIKELTQIGIAEGGNFWQPEITLPSSGFWCARSEEHTSELQSH